VRAIGNHLHMEWPFNPPLGVGSLLTLYKREFVTEPGWGRLADPLHAGALNRLFGS